MSARDRFSLVGHAAMPLMSALVPDELASLLDAAGLAPGDRVLDLGGGRGDLARMAATRLGVRVVSVDRSSLACDEARARTAGLAVEVVCGDAQAHLANVAPGSFALACAVGALHAFGEELPSWESGRAALGRVAARVLLADLVALSPRAAAEFRMAPLETLGAMRRGARHEVLLSPARVGAYETAWGAAVAAHVAAHPDDPRNAWAKERLAWGADPVRAAAWSELSFLALVL